MHCLRSLFFLWLNPLLATGFRKPLQQHHVPALSEGAQDTAKVSYARLSESLSRGHRHHDCSSAAALFWCIVKCHWVDLCGTGALALLKAIITSCNPLFVRYLMVFASKREVSHGYILVAALILTKVIECLAQRHWFFRARRMGLQLRSALVAAIYNKALKLSHRSRQRHSSGEIVSYISIDAYRLGEFMWWFHQLWTLFLRILIALGILLKLVRLATLSGLLIIVATTVIQAPLAKIQQRNQSKLSTAQDHRLRISSSVFSSMKIIKLQAWEGYFQQLIESFRAREYKWLYGVKEIGSVGSVIYYMSPIVTACVVLATCIPLSIKLDAVLVFTVLSTFRVIQQPLKVLPQALTAAIQAQVSLQRLSKFFNDEELQGNAVVSDRYCGLYDAISIDAATFGWEQSGAFALVDLTLKVRNGELVAVCGAVGSGKSTLLQSILGEVPRLSGSSRVCGSLAYVSQTAWIRSGTVRENILFGKVMDTALYERVIKACALGEDIASFSHGDLTEIGERGLNLSGGQKQRLQLARALYADADIYLLDDPFSAVDAHTAAILFQECLLNELKNKTVILVTHQVEFLSSAGKILVMDSGSILHSGCYQELLSSVEVFDRLVNAHEDVSSVYQKHSKNEHNQRRCRDQYSDDRNAFSNSSVKKGSYEQLTREETAEGSVGLKPYLDYICVSSGKTLTGLGIVLQGFLTGAALWSNYWLAREVANPRRSVRSLIGVFAAVSCATSVFVYARARVFVSLGFRASQAFFSGLNTSLFGAPMAFFDSTPIGRILGRASADISLLDVEVQTYLSVFLVGCFELAGILVVTTLVTWQIIFVAVPTLALIWLTQAYCSKSSRALVRINGITKAPVLNLTAETVNGAVTVRAFRKQAMFMTQNMQLVDADAAISLHTYAAHEWFLMRAELLGTIILSAAALLIMIYRHHVRPGFAGFSLAYAFSLNANIFFTSNALNYLESYIISVERISHYMRLPAEAPSVIPTNRPPASWPMHGDIELHDLQIRYRPDSPLVIKGISCKFPGGKRVGLVGRTGSGKTTLISALFRLVEPAGGRIIIDGVDITTIGLLDLRTRIGVIPQEAFLFRGTVRSNLDPFHQFTDEQIWQSLRKCQLDGALKETSMKLDSIVSDDGENWSVGQRQLFCLARVLLKRSKVLVLDEATASVDSTTDAVLQRVIRDEFIGSTVITVAHRIPTVIDSDMVLGLKDGYKVEYDSPQALLDDKDSLFAKLVAECYSTS